MGFRSSVPISRWLLVCLPLCGWTCAALAEVPQSPVGIPHRMTDVILPAPQCQAVPWDDPRQPIVLRVLQVVPHGDAFRYQMEFYGLDPGDYDLSQWLQAADGTAHPALPAIPARVVSQLPPGQIQPQSLEAGRLPWMGGYRLALVLSAIAWTLGGVALWWMGRRRRVAAVVADRPVATWADRLRPLLQAARDGRLSVSEQAELERLLLGYWCRRLSAEPADSSEGMLALRAHPQAGPLVRQLEAWLHAPGPGDAVDLEQLLAPYRDAVLEEDGLTGQAVVRSGAASP